MKKYVPSLLVLALLAAGCGKEPTATAPAAAQPAGDIAAGKAVAESKCVSCHGLDGKGTGPDIPNLGGQKVAYLLNALNGYRTGTRQHAALQQLSSELTEADVNNIAAYYASQKAAGAAAAAGVADTVAAGKAAATVCAACHGSDGNSKVPGTPSLAGQHPGYLLSAMQAYKAGSRKDATMSGQVAKLDQVTMENIAAYFAAQTPVERDKSSAGDAKAGEPLSGKCGGCHGQQGHSADEKTPSLAGQDAQYLVKTMKNYRDGGRAHAEMKSMLAGVKDQDLAHVAAFYVAQAPKAAGVAKPTAGQQWAERCDKCHGAAVDNPEMVTPHLEGQPVAYLVKALKDYREGKRVQSAMHAMGAPLSDADIQAIAEYYAGQQPK
ncbi:cytochrome c4 [Parasulfuritortus cantonensis]|uniref:Cytochrome c4 n=1 Tax=Parasulfuritortus cantonensis TaxID=2528202 RepID=A0A4R1BQV1_9PROT|nr:c-type cytochrome [Parasulfuritortus cantonensis]TCJ19545.1 cytochrome c4 [Parasulfuritortus cantonensis]